MSHWGFGGSEHPRPRHDPRLSARQQPVLPAPAIAEPLRPEAQPPSVDLLPLPRTLGLEGQTCYSVDSPSDHEQPSGQSGHSRNSLDSVTEQEQPSVEPGDSIWLPTPSLPSVLADGISQVALTGASGAASASEGDADNFQDLWPAAWSLSGSLDRLLETSLEEDASRPPVPWSEASFSFRHVIELNHPHDVVQASPAQGSELRAPAAMVARPVQAPDGQVLPGMQGSELRAPASMVAHRVQAPDGQVLPGMQAFVLVNADGLTFSQVQAMMAAVEALRRVHGRHGDAGTGGVGAGVSADAAGRPANPVTPAAVLVPPGAGAGLMTALLHMGQGGVAVALPNTVVYNVQEPVEEVVGGNRCSRRRHGQTMLRLVRAFSHVGLLEAETEDKCTVCLEDMEVGQVVRTLPCFHMLHGNCSSRYFRAFGVPLICPVCRAPVVPSE